MILGDEVDCNGMLEEEVVPVKEINLKFYKKM